MMTEQTRPLPPHERSLVSGLAPGVAVAFLGFLAVALPLPTLSLYVHGVLGFDASVVGWTIGLQSLVTVLTRDRAGLLCDARGPRWAVLVGLPIAMLSGACYLASGLLPLGAGARLALVLAGRVAMGVGESLFVTGTMTWGIGRVGVQRTGRVMSWQGIALYASLGLGAPLGLAVQAAWGFSGVGWLVVAAPVAAMLVAVWTPGVAGRGAARPAAGDAAEWGRLRVVGAIWRPGSVMALAVVPFAAMSAFLALDFAQRGWSGAGAALAGFGVAYVFVRLVGTGWLEQYGAMPVTAISLAVEALGQVLVWLSPSPLVAMAGATLTGAGFSLVFPAMGVAATRMVPPEQRGRAVGNFLAFFDVALGLTGPLAGGLVLLSGTRSVFLMGVAAVLASAVVLAPLRRRLV